MLYVLYGGEILETFGEKLDLLSARYNQVLKEYNQNTTPHILGIIAKQFCLADEFIKASTNIKIAC